MFNQPDTYIIKSSQPISYFQREIVNVKGTNQQLNSEAR